MTLSNLVRLWVDASFSHLMYAETSAHMIQVQPGNVEVSSIASKVSNGEVVSNSPSPPSRNARLDSRRKMRCASTVTFATPFKSTSDTD